LKFIPDLYRAIMLGVRVCGGFDDINMTTISQVDPQFSSHAS
jgi:hypothetical protein